MRNFLGKKNHRSIKTVKQVELMTNSHLTTGIYFLDLTINLIDKIKMYYTLLIMGTKKVVVDLSINE